MYFKNSIGEVYIEDNSVIYKNSLGIVQVTPHDFTQVQYLYEYYVVHFKNLELLETDPKQFREMYYDDDV